MASNIKRAELQNFIQQSLGFNEETTLLEDL